MFTVFSLGLCLGAHLVKYEGFSWFLRFQSDPYPSVNVTFCDFSGLVRSKMPPSTSRKVWSKGLAAKLQARVRGRFVRLWTFELSGKKFRAPARTCAPYIEQSPQDVLWSFLQNTALARTVETPESDSSVTVPESAEAPSAPFDHFADLALLWNNRNGEQSVGPPVSPPSRLADTSSSKGKPSKVPRSGKATVSKQLKPNHSKVVQVIPPSASVEPQITKAGLAKEPSSSERLTSNPSQVDVSQVIKKNLQQSKQPLDPKSYKPFFLDDERWAKKGFVNEVYLRLTDWLWKYNFVTIFQGLDKATRGDSEKFFCFATVDGNRRLVLPKQVLYRLYAKKTQRPINALNRFVVPVDYTGHCAKLRAQFLKAEPGKPLMLVSTFKCVCGGDENGLCVDIREFVTDRFHDCVAIVLKHAKVLPPPLLDVPPPVIPMDIDPVSTRTSLTLQKDWLIEFE